MLTVLNKFITIKDAGLNTNINLITIETEGAQTIEGETTAIINGSGDSLSLYCDGSNWFIY